MIAIKNFQMPYDCSTCLFCVKRKTGDYGYYGSCYINNEDGINLLNHTRDSECPLVEIEVADVNHLSQSLNLESNVKAILECNFAGFKDEIIENACKLICNLKINDDRQKESNVTRN